MLKFRIFDLANSQFSLYFMKNDGEWKRRDVENVKLKIQVRFVSFVVLENVQRIVPYNYPIFIITLLLFLHSARCAWLRNVPQLIARMYSR